MEEKQINQNNNQGNPPVEDKNIDIRTMESDIKSIESEGTPHSYNPVITEQQKSGEQQNINLEGLEGTTAIPQNQEVKMGEIPSTIPPSKASKNKGLVIGIVTFVIIVGLAALAYFVVYPLLTSQKSSEENVGNISTSTTETTSNLPVSETATETTQGVVITPEETIVVTTTPTSTDTSKQIEIERTSPFSKVDGVVTSSKVVMGKNITSLVLPTTSMPALVEIKFTSPDVKFSSIMKELFSLDLTQSGLADAFDENYTTGFIFVEKNGTKRLGYIAKLKTNSNLVDEKTSLGKAIESNSNLKNIFNADPGSIEGWKNGSEITSPHRYTLFSKAGYSIDYGWKGDLFIISSSFEGFKTAVANLK